MKQNNVQKILAGLKPQNLLIIRATKCFVDPTKYLVKSTKLFGCYNQIRIFGRFNKKIYFNQQKFVWYNQIFMDIQQNSFFGSRKLFSAFNRTLSSTIQPCAI